MYCTQNHLSYLTNVVSDWHLSAKPLPVDVSVLGTGDLASRTTDLKAPWRSYKNRTQMCIPSRCKCPQQGCYESPHTRCLRIGLLRPAGNLPVFPLSIRNTGHTCPLNPSYNMPHCAAILLTIYNPNPYQEIIDGGS